MKRIMIALLAAALMLCGSAIATEPVTMTNPWTKTNSDGVLEAVGTTLNLPEDATNILWLLNKYETLAEIQFTWDHMQYTARIRPSEAFEDISGLYYDWENVDEDFTIGDCQAWEARADDEDTTIDLCLWYDAAAKQMYSLTTSGPDHLDGFDITAVAQQIYLPAGSDA